MTWNIDLTVWREIVVT